MESGFSLLEALRQRRAFPVAEVLQLTQKLPVLLDGPDGQMLAPECALIQELCVHFDSYPSALEQTTLPRKSVSQWPTFSLRLRPKSRGLAFEMEMPNGTTFFRHSSRPASVAARFAELLYELLGGHHRSSREGFHPPLAALSAEGNTVLLRGLQEGAFASCDSFWREWFAACRTQIAAALIPERFFTLAEPGEDLTLTPEDPKLPRIKLVARRQFRIGRSATQSDWVSRFLPLTPENRILSEQLSRVHLVAERFGQGIGLRDGDGHKRSANGSTWAEQALSAREPQLIEQPGAIGIGPNYSLELIPAGPSRPVTISNIDAWLTATGVPSEQAPPVNPQLAGKECQALIFTHHLPSAPFRDALWLFSRIGFDVAPTGGIAWHQGGKVAAAATFVYEQGCFWLLRDVGHLAEFALEGVALKPLEIAPLISGQRWKIGPTTYRVSVGEDPDPEPEEL